MRAASSGSVVPAMGLAGEGAEEAAGMLELGKDCSGIEEAQITVVGVFVRGGVPGADSTTTEGMGDEAKQQTGKRQREREGKKDRDNGHYSSKVQTTKSDILTQAVKVSIAQIVHE